MTSYSKIHKKVNELRKLLGLPYIFVFQTPFFNSFSICSIHLIHINSEENYIEHVTHEIAHLHLKANYGDVIGKAQFRKLFGDIHAPYFGKWYWTSCWEDAKSKPEYVNLYAQVHPAEDYCETFCHAWTELQTGKQYYYGNRLLNTKVKAVKGWIEATMTS